MLQLTTLVVGLLSALCPFVNLEVYIAGVGALGTDTRLWPLSIAAAAGQTIGKLVWYQVGASSMQWPFIARKMQSAAWSRTLSWVRGRFDQRPWIGLPMILLSASVGIPPLAIISVLCGQLQFNRWLFAGMVFVGRVVRFATILGGTAWVLGAA